MSAKTMRVPMTARKKIYQAEQWDSQSLVAIVKQPLIQQCKQCIQDGTVGFENLVNEGNLCCWQVAVCLPCVLIILQTYSTYIEQCKPFAWESTLKQKCSTS